MNGGFHIAIRAARRHERRYIESASAEPIASDHCVLVWFNLQLVGWADDYGSFHPIPPGHDGLTEAGEKLLEAVQGFLEAAR